MKRIKNTNSFLSSLGKSPRVSDRNYLRTVKVISPFIWGITALPTNRLILDKTLILWRSHRLDYTSLCFPNLSTSQHTQNVVLQDTGKRRTQRSKPATNGRPCPASPHPPVWKPLKSAPVRRFVPADAPRPSVTEDELGLPLFLKSVVFPSL